MATWNSIQPVYYQYQAYLIIDYLLLDSLSLSRESHQPIDHTLESVQDRIRSPDKTIIQTLASLPALPYQPVLRLNCLHQGMPELVWRHLWPWSETFTLLLLEHRLPCRVLLFGENRSALTMNTANSLLWDVHCVTWPQSQGYQNLSKILVQGTSIRHKSKLFRIKEVD